MANNKSLQFLRGKGYNSTEVLLEGQPYYDMTHNRLYVGDGKTALRSLPCVFKNDFIRSTYQYLGGAQGSVVDLKAPPWGATKSNYFMIDVKNSSGSITVKKSSFNPFSLNTRFEVATGLKVTIGYDGASLSLSIIKDGNPTYNEIEGITFFKFPLAEN